MSLQLINSIAILQEKKLMFITKCRCRGMSDTDIVKAVKRELGIDYSKKKLKEDFEELISEWRERRAVNINLLQMEEYMKRQEVINEGWEEWNKSKGLKIDREIRKTLDADGNVIQSTEIIKEKYGEGNPRFLQIISDQYTEQAKILDVYRKLDTMKENDFEVEVKEVEVVEIVEKLRPKVQALNQADIEKMEQEEEEILIERSFELRKKIEQENLQEDNE